MEPQSRPDSQGFADEIEFRPLLAKAQQGDEAAARQLIALYEPEIRRFVRVRLTDPALKRILDSIDIAQSVLGRFFWKLRSDAITVEHPLQLLKLLLVMARNSLFDHARKARIRREFQGARSDGLEQAASPHGGPDDQVEARDLATVIRGHLSPEHRTLLDLRLQGQEWNDISVQLNASPEALRKRLTRALDDAARSLGLIEDSDA
jgi:RNA polymerase sigma factor (sigma-70 family)